MCKPGVVSQVEGAHSGNLRGLAEAEVSTKVDCERVRGAFELGCELCVIRGSENDPRGVVLRCDAVHHLPVAFDRPSFMPVFRGTAQYDERALAGAGKCGKCASPGGGKHWNGRVAAPRGVGGGRPNRAERCCSLVRNKSGPRLKSSKAGGHPVGMQAF